MLPMLEALVDGYFWNLVEFDVFNNLVTSMNMKQVPLKPISE
jgi:hypothetical protein